MFLPSALGLWSFAASRTMTISPCNSSGLYACMHEIVSLEAFDGAAGNKCTEKRRQDDIDLDSFDIGENLW